MRRTGRNAGYTLIEIMVVVAIIATVMLVVVTSMDDLTPWSRLSSGGREIASAIQFVASEAGATGRTHWLTYDLENAQHWVVLPRTEREQELYGEGAFKKTGKEDDSDRRILQRGLPEGVVFLDVVVGDDDRRNKGELKFEFGPLGLAPAHTVHLGYEKDEQLQLSIGVNPVTSETRILDGYSMPSYVSNVKK